MKNIRKSIYEIMVYINLNLFEHITLDLLSEKFSYSKFHLHRKFKEISGVTLNQYIKHRRIETSIYFLFANLNEDISTIAEYCGFTSATYSREFKKLFNRTPKEWRTLYKNPEKFKEISNICKNYERFICYIDNGIPKEIKSIKTVDINPLTLSAVIFYGNYYSNELKSIWEQIKAYNSNIKTYIGIPFNSPSVTNINSCLYGAGFEDSMEPHQNLSKIEIEGGSYIKMDFSGERSKLSEVYTYIMKFYMPSKSLRYDYRVQLQEYEKDFSFDKETLNCKLYIPVTNSKEI